MRDIREWHAYIPQTGMVLDHLNHQWPASEAFVEQAQALVPASEWNQYVLLRR